LLTTEAAGAVVEVVVALVALLPLWVFLLMTRDWLEVVVGEAVPFLARWSFLPALSGLILVDMLKLVWRVVTAMIYEKVILT
jgi:hypothetical protein